jgi:transcriptional regulator with XRE-family HTH domain
MVSVSETDLSDVVRQRLRGLRQARGWSLDALAARCHLSPSTLSRIETGHRRIDLDQLVALAHALDTTIDHLVEPVDDADVIIRPVRHQEAGLTTWILSRDATQHAGRLVAKMRITPERRTGPGHLAVHPGREWFTVLSGTVLLHLGERQLTVAEGEAAEFSTMIPHSIGALGGPAEILTMFDQEGERAHAEA